MTFRLLSLTLLVAGLGRATAQNQVPSGTPLLVQPPQAQMQPAVTFVLAYPMLAVPDTTPMPSRVKLTLSRPADTLEVLGQPRGMTVTITQDTVTIETKGVPVGQYPLRITGRWGNETKAVELLVSVYALNGAVTPITGPAEPGPTIPTTQVPKPTQATTLTPVVRPVQITTPTATLSTVAATGTVTPVQISTPVAVVTTPEPQPTSTSVTVTTTTEITPIQTAPVQTVPAVTGTPLAPPTTATAAPVMPQAVPQAAPITVAPVTAAPSIPTMTVPYQTPPLRAADSGRRFTVWGGMGTERGIVGGLNVGISSRIAQFRAFQVAVRGTAELYPNTGSGLGLPVIGADVLLSREGSRLYYGPSTSLAFGAGNSWAVGGLVGYSSTWNKDLGYYLEGRARYAHLGGQTALSPGFRVGFTYKLNR